MEMEASGSSSSCLQVPSSEGPQGSFSGCLQVPPSDGPQGSFSGCLQGLSSDCPQWFSTLPQLSSYLELEEEFNQMSLNDPEPESGVAGLVEELWNDFDKDEEEIRELEREIAILGEEERQLDEEMHAFRQTSEVKRAELEQTLKTEQEEYAKLKIKCQSIQKICEEQKKEEDALADLDGQFYEHYEKLFELFGIDPETKRCAEGKPVNVRNPKEGDCDIWNCPILCKEIPEESMLNLTPAFGGQNMKSVNASTLKHSGNETTKSNISTLKYSGNETTPSNVSTLKHSGNETTPSNVSTLKHSGNEMATFNVPTLKYDSGNEMATFNVPTLKYDSGNEMATFNVPTLKYDNGNDTTVTISTLEHYENEVTQTQPIVVCESETKQQAEADIYIESDWDSEEDLFKE